MRCAATSICVLAVMGLRLAAGATPPAVVTGSFRAMGGEKVSLEALRGQIVVLVFADVQAAESEDALKSVRSEVSALGGVTGVAFLVGPHPATAADRVRISGWEYPVVVDEELPKVKGKPVTALAAGFAKKMGVSGYPVCFVLDPEGRLAVGTGGGVAPQLLPNLLREQVKATPPRAASKEVVSAAEGALQLAEGAMGRKEYWAAARYLARVPGEGRRDVVIGERVAAATLALEGASAGMIAETEKLIGGGGYGEAVVKLEWLRAALAGTPSEAAVADQLHSVTDDPELKARAEAGREGAEAAGAMAEAMDLDAHVSRARAYTVLKELAAKHPGTAAGKSAAEVLGRWEKDPAEHRKLRDAQDGEKAGALLARADHLAASSGHDGAKALYERVVKDYPGTTAAEKAAGVLKAWK